MFAQLQTRPKTKVRTHSRTMTAPLLTTTKSKTMELLSKSDDLLAAALTAITGTNIVSYEAYLKSHPNETVHKPDFRYKSLPLAMGPVQFDSTANPQPTSNNVMDNSLSDLEGKEPTGLIKIYFSTLSANNFKLTCKPSDTVADIKGRIENIKSIPSQRLHLAHAGKELADGGKTLHDYNVGDGATLTLWQKGSTTTDPLYLPENVRSKEFDFDFANITDTGLTFMRGSHIYKRPIGWTRVAIDVMKFGSDLNWLGGAARTRTQSEREEWPGENIIIVFSLLNLSCYLFLYYNSSSFIPRNGSPSCKNNC